MRLDDTFLITGKKTWSEGVTMWAYWVLNADWHHGEENPYLAVGELVTTGMCSTPIGITGKKTSIEIAKSDEIVLCSTPIGITGKKTWELRDLDVGLVVVLNADWHHGEENLHNKRQAFKGSECSTPIGITGKKTWVHGWRRLPNMSAQRRLASRGRKLALGACGNGC